MVDRNPMALPTVERRRRKNCSSFESSRRHSQCLRRATSCANNRRFERTALLLMVSAGAIPCAKSEICVETDINVFLCTKDMARARREAMKRNGEPVRFASNLNLGVEQRNDGEAHQQRKVSQRMKKVEEYFETIVLADRNYDGVRDKCLNKHELCTFWAATADECAKNPGYMLVDCAAACMSCDKLL